MLERGAMRCTRQWNDGEPDDELITLIVDDDVEDPREVGFPNSFDPSIVSECEGWFAKKAQA